MVRAPAATKCLRIAALVRNVKSLIMPAMKLPPIATGRPPKRVRSQAEIDEAAARFAADWRDGDTVQTWLNVHEGQNGELSRMVASGWSWADVGRALFEAGICYRTGRPIPSATLQVKASLARANNRAAVAPVIAVPKALAEIGEPPFSSSTDAPVFELVRARDGIPLAGWDTGELDGQPPLTAAEDDEVADAAIYERVFGKRKPPQWR